MGEVWHKKYLTLWFHFYKLWNKGRQNDIVRCHVLNHPWRSAGLWVAKWVPAICVCVCKHVCTGTCVCVYTWEVNISCLPQFCATYLLRQRLSLTLEFTYSTGLVDQQIPEVLLSMSPQHQDYRHELLLPSMGFWKIWSQVLMIASSRFLHICSKSWLIEAFNLWKFSVPITVRYILSVSILNILFYFEGKILHSTR